MTPLVMAAPRVMVSAPVPPVMLAAFLMVPVLAPLAKVSLLAPVPRSTAMPVVSSTGEGDGVVAGAAGERLNVGDGERCWRSCRG